MARGVRGREGLSGIACSFQAAAVEIEVKCRSLDSLSFARSLGITAGVEVCGFPLMRDETAHEWGTLTRRIIDEVTAGFEKDDGLR